MYGKIFDSIYDGTLVEDWRALITFQQLIVLCDADGVVDMTPHAISRRTGIPIEHIEAGLRVLENPDPYSRTEAEEGRRIMRLDAHRPWGWLIVNHEKYKQLQDSDTVRAQTRERVRKHRELKKQAVTDGNGSVTDVTASNGQKRHTDTDTNKDGPFDLWWTHYPCKRKKKQAQAIWNRKGLDSRADELIADVCARKERDQQWVKGFIPHPTTYLNGELWNDELAPAEATTTMQPAGSYTS